MAVPFNATVRVKTSFVIHRQYYTDGSICPDDAGYWRFEETNDGATFSEGWVGPSEASKYATAEQGRSQIIMRNLISHTDPRFGLHVMEIVEDSKWPGGWMPLSSIVESINEPLNELNSKDDSIRDPRATPLDYQPIQGPKQESHICLPAFNAFLSALAVENIQTGFEPYAYRMNRGIITHYKYFRTFQPDTSNEVEAFHFESDFDTIYTRSETP